MKIFILGYMGSGKTETGKQLAKEMGLHFIDLDKLFEKQQHTSITDYFKLHGEEKFREIEHQLLKSVLNKDNVIISTGGGTPCFYDNMEIINNNGISVYLKMDVDTLVHRITNSKQTRPLVQKLSGDELKRFVEKQLLEREPYYSTAKHIVDAKNINIPDIASLLTSK